MKRSIWISLLLSLCLLAGMASAETATVTSKGFGGDVTVTLTVEDGVLTGVAIEGANETPGVGSRAVEPAFKETLNNTSDIPNSVS